MLRIESQPLANFRALTDADTDTLLFDCGWLRHRLVAVDHPICSDRIRVCVVRRYGHACSDIALRASRHGIGLFAGVGWRGCCVAFGSGWGGDG